MKKTSSDGVQEGTQRSCAERKQNSIGTSAAAQPISAQTAASQATAIQPVAANQPADVDVCANPVTAGLGVAVSSAIIKEKPTVFIDTPVNQEQVLRHCEQSNRGSSVANPDISPISNNAVKLLLSEQDRAQVVREIQRIEKRNIIAHVLGIRPRRADLRLLLQAALKQEIDNITDIQMLGRNCYQIEFEQERMVPILLGKKAVAVKGGWVSFHKWIHNFSANQVFHDLQLYHTCMVVFPNLRKEWMPFVHLIASNIGTVLETYDKPRQDEEKSMGAASAKILISKTAVLPSTVLLPNLLDPSQEFFSQKVLYKGLPNQCFRCFGFGHLAKNCPKITKGIDKHVPSTNIMSSQDRSQGWIEVGHRKTSSQVNHDKPHYVASNSLKEFPLLQNRYSTLYVEQDYPKEVNVVDHSSSYLPQQRLDSVSTSEKTDLHSSQLPNSFPRLVVGQPPLKIVENQQLVLSTSANLVSSEKLKQKVVDTQHMLDVEMPQSGTTSGENQQLQAFSNSNLVDDLSGQLVSGQPSNLGLDIPCDGFQFTVSQDSLTTQTTQNQVKEHRVHKYAGNYLILKRQARAQEGAQKGRHEALLEKRTSLKPK